MTIAILIDLLVAVCAFARPHDTRAPRLRWFTVAFAALLPVATAAAFWSFAAHLHATFGGWPTWYGDDRFPPALATHANVAQGCFALLLAGTLFVLPPAALLCWATTASRSRVRSANINAGGNGLRILGWHGVWGALCFLAITLAPAPLQRWWWD